MPTIASHLNPNLDVRICRLVRSAEKPTLLAEHHMFVNKLTSLYSNMNGETLRLKLGQELDTFLHDTFDEEERAFQKDVHHIRFCSAHIFNEEREDRPDVVDFLSVELKGPAEEVEEVEDDNGTGIGAEDGKSMYLRQMVVATEWQRRGVGQALVRYAVEDADDVPAVTVAVRRSNEKAKRFYSRLGFIEAGACHSGLDPELYCRMVWDRAAEKEVPVEDDI